MEEKMIIVSQVKSNRSEFMVWQVGISGETAAQYCKSPLKALRCAFLMKKEKGVKIASDSIAALQQEISRQKEADLEKANVERIDVGELSASVRKFKELKAKHPDALLLFLEEDFYTAYSQDAEEVSDILGIVITKKGRRDTASFPSTAIDTYLPKLVKTGKRIAIVEPNKEAAA